MPHGPVVRDLAHAASLSPKMFAARFSAQVGTRPKLYARIQRFRRVLHDIHSARRVSWTQLAVDWGGVILCALPPLTCGASTTSSRSGMDQAVRLRRAAARSLHASPHFAQTT